MSFRIKKPTSTFKTKGMQEPKEELKEESKETKSSKKKQSTSQAEFE